MRSPEYQRTVERDERRVRVFGTRAVLEALADERVPVERLLVARTARGGAVEEVLAAAASRGLRAERVAPEKVHRASGSPSHDQGVLAEVVAEGIEPLEAWLDRRPGPAPVALLVLDGVTNPANVGMVVRSAAGAGLDGTVLPRTGTPDIGPLLLRASAGVALRAPLLRAATAATAVDALVGTGVTPVGLRATEAPSLFDGDLPPRAAYVLGNEAEGVSPAVAERVHAWRSIPLSAGVESLNVAATAAVVAFEVARRRGGDGAGRAT
jgi:23S rRNA (guanosine2251-2'-O)-methyltransferase